MRLEESAHQERLGVLASGASGQGITDQPAQQPGGRDGRQPGPEDKTGRVAEQQAEAPQELETRRDAQNTEVGGEQSCFTDMASTRWLLMYLLLTCTEPAAGRWRVNQSYIMLVTLV